MHAAFCTYEVAVLNKLSHPNIIKVLDFYEIKSPRVDDSGRDDPLISLHIVFELLDTNLCAFMKEFYDDGLGVDGIQLFSKQIFQGLEYLHANEFIHRDIKPENILLDTTNYTLKICDFGMVK